MAAGFLEQMSQEIGIRSCNFLRSLGLEAGTVSFCSVLLVKHHWFNGHELGQTPGDGEGQGILTCYSPWGHKQLDTTWQLNNRQGLNVGQTASMLQYRLRCLEFQLHYLLPE